MDPGWNASVARHVAQACSAISGAQDASTAIQKAMGSAMAIAAADIAVYQAKQVDPAVPGNASFAIPSRAAEEIPPALLEQVLRTGRSLGPPGLDGDAGFDEPANGSGPMCALAIRSGRRIRGALALRLNGGPPVDASTAAALGAVADCLACRLRSEEESALAAPFLAHLERAKDLQEAAGRRRRLRLTGVTEIGPYAGILGQSEAVLNMLRSLDRVLAKARMVLVCGETGTGKELVARAVHQRCRPKGEFVVANCGHLRGELSLSELMGHEKGAFTGATDKSHGLLARADGGVLFLDELHLLTRAAQGDLLRFFDDLVVRPLGGSKEIKLDILIVLATNENLDRLESEGEFRRDFLYRVQRAMVEVPPLRDRVEDIPLLVDRWLAEVAHGITPEAMTRLMVEEWPGNIRQLKQVVMAACTLCDGIVEDRHLVEVFRLRHRQVDPSPQDLSTIQANIANFTVAGIVQALRIAGGNLVRAAGLLEYSVSGYRKLAARFGVNLPLVQKCVRRLRCQGER